MAEQIVDSGGEPLPVRVGWLLTLPDTRRAPRLGDRSHELAKPAGTKQAVPDRELGVIAATGTLVDIRMTNLDQGHRRLGGVTERLGSEIDPGLHRRLRAAAVALEVGADRWR